LNQYRHHAIVESENGLSDQCMATLLANLSGKLILEEMPDISCARRT